MFVVSVYVACERVRVLCYFPLSDREIRINGGTACFFPFLFHLKVSVFLLLFELATLYVSFFLSCSVD